MYILSFTCLNTRAVHLDLIPDMSTHSFVSALLRFSNKFGFPSHIYSDNDRSFLKGCDVISEFFLFQPISGTFPDLQYKTCYHSCLLSLGMQYLGKVDSSSQKTVLEKTVGPAKIEYFEMLTLVCDVENAANSTSESDLEVINPNSFTYPNSNSNLFLMIEGENTTLSEPPSQSLLLESLSNRNRLLEHFHELWNNAYLLSLRNSTKNSYEHRFENRINIEDIILIRHPQKSRPFWMLGRVVEFFKGDDNKIRSANVKRDGSTQNYSINHLYPLELQQLTNESILPCNNVHEASPVGHLLVETVRRSARSMAQTAKSQ